MAILEVNNLEKHFGSTRVLEDISFDLEKGKALAIIGSSGSGKTTLLRCLNFLETPDQGTISVGGNVIFDAANPQTQTDSEIRKKRLHFGMVFQSFNLFPQYTALKNVTLAKELLARERPDFKANKKAILEEIQQEGLELLTKMGLEQRASHYPSQLSGGQQQRVAIARAIAAQSPVLMADEPTGALDSKTGAQVLALMREMNRTGTTVILITHDNGIAAQADRTVRVKDGKIVHDSLWDGVLVDLDVPARRVAP